MMRSCRPRDIVNLYYDPRWQLSGKIAVEEGYAHVIVQIVSNSDEAGNET